MWGFAWQNLITRPSRTALAVVGLTIPILAFLGLFSISRGIRDLVGGTLVTMQGLLVLRENSPSPVFSDLPADMAVALRGIPGVRVPPGGALRLPADRPVLGVRLHPHRADAPGVVPGDPRAGPRLGR